MTEDGEASGSAEPEPADYRELYFWSLISYFLFRTAGYGFDSFIFVHATMVAQPRPVMVNSAGVSLPDA